MITIITPTYNRCEYLPRVFQSLKNQTQWSFEWIIVDDGSEDDTSAIVSSFVSSFEIKYFKTKNGGRHRAINYGVRRASYDFCLLLDSDDYLTPDAVEKIEGWISTVAENQKIAAVAGLKKYENGSNTCNVVEGSGKFLDCSNLERDKIGLSFDCAEIYRTSILKSYPFPEFEKENFISEVSVWNSIAKDGYLIRWFYESIYVCEYLDGGLSKNIISKLANNPKGFAYVVKNNISCYSGIRRLKEIGFYTAVMRTTKCSYKKISTDIEVGVVKCILLGFLYSLKRKLQK